MKQFNEIFFFIFFIILLLSNYSKAKTIIGKAKIIDGDTIHININKIRLHGIDAPETKQTCKIESQDWFCGKQSTKELKKLINNQNVECRANDIDIYNGSDSSIDKLNGNWIVINYWADWCAPCIKEIPELNEFASENDDLLVYTFNFDQLDEEDLAPIAEKFNIQVPSLITHPRDIWGIQTPPAVPATFFINPKGKIVLSLFRPQTKDALNKIFSELKQAG